MPLRAFQSTTDIRATAVSRYARHITINATGALAAVLRKIGFPEPVMRGVAVVSPAAALVGHIVEEQREPAGRYIWDTIEREVPYQAEA